MVYWRTKPNHRRPTTAQGRWKTISTIILWHTTIVQWWTDQCPNVSCLSDQGNRARASVKNSRMKRSLSITQKMIYSMYTLLIRTETLSMFKTYLLNTALNLKETICSSKTIISKTISMVNEDTEWRMILDSRKTMARFNLRAHVKVTTLIDRVKTHKARITPIKEASAMALKMEEICLTKVWTLIKMFK